MSVIQANASVTHTYGNVACVAMDYIKKFFSEDYFKIVHISTKLAYRQLDVFRTKQEFWKLHKPILIMRPRIELDDSSKYFYGSAMTNRVHNVRSPMEFANRVDLLKDLDNGVNVQFLWNRSKIYYDIVMIFDSFNEQINMSNRLMNMIVPNAPFPIHTPLESYVPKSMIYSIADYLKVPRTDTATILSYLNTHSSAPFTYKFKDGSGNDEYFTMYGTNIEAIASDLSIDEGSERGLITDNYTLSFTLSCEFYNMGCYYLMLRDGLDRFMQPPLDKDMDKDGHIITLFTIPLLERMELDPGWKILIAPSYKVTDRDIDTVELKDIIDAPLRRVMEYQRKTNLPQDLFMKIRVFEGSKELFPSDTTYSIDLSDLDNPKLYTYNGNPKETYRLVVTVNNGFIHSITTEINQFNKEK